MLRLNIILAVMLTSSVVLAEEKKPWVIEVDLGAVSTSGNTETTSIRAKLDAKQNLNQWTNQYVFSSFFKQDLVLQDDKTKTSEKTAEKYLGSLKSSYQMSKEDKSYLFGFGSYTQDKFGAYRTYSTLAFGYGDWLYTTDKVNWFVEAGPGYFRGEKVLQDKTVDSVYLSETDQGAMLRLATEVEWKVTPTAVFKQVLGVEAGSNNTRATSETSLAASITDAMQMKLAFAVASDSKVSKDKEKTDTITSATIVYKF